MSHPFLGKPAPPGYVAGVGRGATGFTTRSDIGPARDEAPTTRGVKRGQPDDDDEELLHESNYDEFAGYGGSLVNKDPYDEDDEEADKIYDQIEKHLDERGKALREAKTREELERYRQERPKIQQQFQDLKASLSLVRDEEWMNIPEVGDARNRKQRVGRQDKFTPVPDSLLAHQAKLARGGDRLVYLNSLDEEAMEEDDTNSTDDKVLAEQQPSTSSGLTSNIGEMSEFRSSYMTMKLSRVSDSTVDAQKVADPQDYLTNLQSMVPSQITDESTLKEYRKQFASLRASNPSFPNAWIASARLEEAAGKIKAARTLILSACERCPKSADIWLEAVRLQPPDLAKSLMVRALKELPRSVKLWCRAGELETDDLARRKVYAKACELVPKSALLWKRSVELEQPKEARAILRQAVECCPEDVELWLLLAGLEEYETAKQVLARARTRHPKDRSIWLTEAKLEELSGNNLSVDDIINQAVKRLLQLGVQIQRDEWLDEAAKVDKGGFGGTAAAVVRRLLGYNIGADKRLDTWMEDARKFVSSGAHHCARAAFECIVADTDFRSLDSAWHALVDFERQHGERKSLESALKRALAADACAKSETFWLELSRLYLEMGEAERSWQVLIEASQAIPSSERLQLASVEMLCNAGRHKEARKLLADACMSSAGAGSAGLVRRAAELERSLENLDEAVRLLKAATSSQPHRNQADLYLMLGEIEEQRGRLNEARLHYSAGLKFCPSSVDLWISLAHLDEKAGSAAKARSRLEMARLRNPRVARLWLEAAQLELRAHLAKQAIASRHNRARPDVVSSLLSKGIKECAESPDLSLLLEEQAKFNSRRFA